MVGPDAVSPCLVMAFANAVRFNTTVSAADSRLAGMAYAQKLAQSRLERSQQRSKWYTLSEEERSDILFPAPRMIHSDYKHATVEQQICAETHFKGGGIHWRPEPLGRQVTTPQLQNLDQSNPVHQAVLPPAHRPWHAGGGGFEGVGSPGPGTGTPQKRGFIAEKIGVDPSR